MQININGLMLVIRYKPKLKVIPQLMKSLCVTLFIWELLSRTEENSLHIPLSVEIAMVDFQNKVSLIWHKQLSFKKRTFL